jgi:P27 family predicted phage terminase small subunit
MGKRGPKPTPTALLKLRGTFRKHRSKGEPDAGDSIPQCPDWLDEQAKHAWEQVVPQLASMGVLAEIDCNALARYVTFWSRWKAAELFLAKNGSVYPLKDEAGKLKCLVQVPQVAIAHKLGMSLSRLEAEFGMTPSARSRIQALPGGADEDDDPLREFMHIA